MCTGHAQNMQNTWGLEMFGSVGLSCSTILQFLSTALYSVMDAVFPCKQFTACLTHDLTLYILFYKVFGSIRLNISSILVRFFVWCFMHLLKMAFAWHIIGDMCDFPHRRFSDCALLRVLCVHCAGLWNCWIGQSCPCQAMTRKKRAS